MRRHHVEPGCSYNSSTLSRGRTYDNSKARSPQSSGSISPLEWRRDMHPAWGAAAIGALIGLYVSWSRSAIAPEIVAGLMAAVVGAGGVHLLKTDLTKPAAIARARVAGACLFALGAAAVLSTVLAITLRPLMSASTTMDFPSIADASSPFEAALSRAQLRVLGVSPREMTKIIENNKGQWPKPTDAQASEISKFLEKTPKDTPNLEGLFGWEPLPRFEEHRL